MTAESKEPFPDKIFGGRAEESGATIWISAMLPKNDGGWEQRIFKTEEIRHVASTDDKSAKITLYDGTVFPVLMKSEDLWQKVFTPDFRSGGEPISLLSVTGAEAFPPVVKPVELEIPEVQKVKGPEIGEVVEGEGIYIGSYAPKDEGGVSIGKIFNVYAAPEDLVKADASYNMVCSSLSSLKNWHGHDGSVSLDEAHIIESLSSGQYKGRWVIPPMELLASVTGNKYKGALCGTFNISASYLSSSSRDIYIYHLNLFTQTKSYADKDNKSFACRPVRFVEVKP
jgi:hypothetical protein